MSGFDRDHESALRVLAPMREGPLAVAGRAEEQGALRGRVLVALRDQVVDVPATLRAHKRRRTVLSVLGGGAVLAVAAAATLVLVSPNQQSVAIDKPPATSLLRVEALDPVALDPDEGVEQVAATWIDAGGESHALAADALPIGTLELRSNDSAPRLRTAQGVAMKLSPRARLRVRSANTDEGPELRLLAGEVACAVPKLGATRQFAIDAPGARVIVHGTRFSVRATGGTTCVRVTEGLVAVHPEASDAPVKRVGPGEQWGCEPEAKAATPVRAPSKSRLRAARAIEAEDSASEPEGIGTLDAENRLLAEALSAETKNDRVRARRLFAELLREHPSSPLAADAARGLERTSK